MSERVEFSKKEIKYKGSQRIIIKNGIQYTISITQNKQHKYKIIKPFKTKKWIIPSVLLHKFEVINKAEIKKIIERDSNEQQSYDRAFALEIDELYEFNLTNKQYIKFKAFLQLYRIKLNEKFFIIRKGLGLKTTIDFSPIVYLDETKE